MCVHKDNLNKSKKICCESEIILKIVISMRVKIHILYIVLVSLSACAIHNISKETHNKIIPVTSISDKHILSIIEPYKIGIDSVMNEELCFSSIEMTKGKPESLLGNFVTDLCLEMYDTIADICIMNNGGLRSSLPYGKITRGDIYKLMPFDNELVILELDTEEIYELSEYIISRGGEPFSGCNIYSFKDSMNIDLEILDTNNQNQEMINYSTIRVLTSDYLANGGDKMSFFNNKEQLQVGLKVRDAIINYCILEDTITSQLDNRLIINNEK